MIYTESPEVRVEVPCDLCLPLERSSCFCD